MKTGLVCDICRGSIVGPYVEIEIGDEFRRDGLWMGRPSRGTSCDVHMHKMCFRGFRDVLGKLMPELSAQEEDDDDHRKVLVVVDRSVEE